MNLNVQATEGAQNVDMTRETKLPANAGVTGYLTIFCVPFFPFFLGGQKCAFSVFVFPFFLQT